MKTLHQLLKGSYPRIEETVISLLNVIGDGVRIIDTNFKIIYENQSHRELFGYNVGEYCYKAYQQRDQVCENCAVSKSFLDGKVHKDVRSIISYKGLKYVEITSSNLLDDRDRIIAGIEIVRDVTDRKIMEAEKEKLISDLQDALNNINTLTGLIPICAWCKKVRDDKGYWKKVEKYIEEHSDVSFTHGICPKCLQKTDPEAYEEYAEIIVKKLQ
jgi:PAS domain S-box-containing protein